MSKRRADVLLVEQGLAPTRSKAQALILAGKVYVQDRRIDKAAELVDDATVLEVRGNDHPYVSRGGVKLAGALNAFSLVVKGWTVADFGASTGGFTDCLLRHGAAKVYAIDVGYGQLAHTLRTDDRVAVMERTNARHLKRGDLDGLVDLVVIDASFIGLEKLLPAAKRILGASGQVVALVKPQFQVGRSRVGKGGVVRDERDREAAVDAVVAAAVALGFSCEGRADSALKGPRGNQETFIWLQRS